MKNDFMCNVYKYYYVKSEVLLQPACPIKCKMNLYINPINLKTNVYTISR